MARFRMFAIPRNDVPEVSDLAPEYTGDEAELILYLLFFQYEGRQVDFSATGSAKDGNFMVSFPVSEKFPTGAQLTLKEYCEYVSRRGDLEKRIENILSIRSIPNEDLPDVDARLELLDRALAGFFVRAFIRPNDETEQVRLWVERVEDRGVLDQFTPMEWAKLWRLHR